MDYNRGTDAVEVQPQNFECPDVGLLTQRINASTIGSTGFFYGVRGKMNYTVKAHPTKYNGVQYRSRLEARWAAFFDLIEWKHEYEPIDLPGWVPDFRVEWACRHSECDGSHSLLVEVKPYYSLKEFEDHPCMDYPFGRRFGGHFDSVDILVSEGKTAYEIPAHASAAFGINPGISYWEMGHGSGGGEYRIEDWIPKWPELWKEAGNITQWRPRR